MGGTGEPRRVFEQGSVWDFRRFLGLDLNNNDSSSLYLLATD